MYRPIRRATLMLGLLVAAGAALAPAGLARPATSRRYVTRPDLKPPVVRIVARRRGRAPGLIALAPKGVTRAGPMLMDDAGRTAWFRPAPPRQIATDFRVQRYRGRPVLTWWQGRFIPPGSGAGEGLIYDSSYHLLKRVKAGHGYRLDLHELRLTRAGTALVTIYHSVPRDLSSVGGRSDGAAVDGIVQEIDVATGRVVFEWHSLGHVALDESYMPVPQDKTAYDYFHLNSVDEEPNGNLLVSARNTSAAYEIDRATGLVLWRLGGRRSDFRIDSGAGFFFQHDVRRQRDGTVTLFDNGSTRSRALRLRLDMATMTAHLVRAFRPARKRFALSQGSAQLEPGGDLFVGWGMQGTFSEFDPAARLVLDAALPKGDDTYRAYRVRWSGTPATRPSIVVRGRRGAARVYASWNGATAVAAWRLLAGERRSRLARVRTVRRHAFETRLRLRGAARYAAVEALDAAGRALRRSRVVRVPR